MKTVLTLLCLTLLLGTAPQHSTAQTLSRILAKSGLTQEDFNLMSTAAGSLYETVTPKVGQSADWKNKETGSFGTVKLTTYKDNCVYLLHKTNPKGQDKVTEIRNRFCKSADGTWVQQP
jgi:surface antigen